MIITLSNIIKSFKIYRSRSVSNGITAVLFFAFLPIFSFASAGVSINTGKIIIEEPVFQGMYFEIPSVVVKNIGDESAKYSLSIQYQKNQKEMVAENAWFKFDPETFTLLPGESQTVKVFASLPGSTKSGDYFAYIEAKIEKSDKATGSPVSGAVATKLYFKVGETGFFLKCYNLGKSFLSRNSPFASIIVWLIIAFVFYKVAMRLMKHNKKN